MDKKTTDEVLANKIVAYFGYFQEYSLKRIASKCAKLVISEHYRELCYENFKLPAYEEMEEWVLEELKESFDEKVTPLIEQTYPDWTEEEIEKEISRLENVFAEEYEEQLRSTTNAALKELRIRAKEIQKELNAVKRKYIS